MKAIYDVNQIKSILPHRYPFLLVDKIIEMEPGKRIVGVKNVTNNEPFFQGHFPGNPIMPGVLTVEALAQTCGVLALQDEEKRGKLALFASIKEARFRKPVVPGDTLILEVNVTSNRSRIVQCEGVARVDGEVVTEATMMFAIMGTQE
ncbi:MAG: 3-hydroxyacyl-ACP dehydratase FabZ [Candidatus Omnitrophica bacterium]|nr:3-hydroxyacyl-ACP dehydratase FabZ [Candidatus Omnitrophota bacterium]